MTTIDAALEKHNGMIEMSADLRLGLIAVQHTEEFSDDQIATTITEAGYPAKKISYEEYEKIINIAKGQSGQGYNGCGGGCSGCVAYQTETNPGKAKPE